MTVKKTTLSSLRNQEKKKACKETVKVNKLLPNIPTGNVTELNNVIYRGVKLVCDKIGIAQGNLNRNTKPGKECRLEGLVKSL